MITNSGKKIIGKYLLGQTSEYAAYIVAGCGTTASLPGQTLSAGKVNEIKEKTNLDFEMFRVPVTAKGFVKEDDIEKLVFKAEMPTEQRYEITEVALFPAGSNSLAGPYGSKTLATFTPTENWVIGSAQSSSAITTITDATFTNTGADIVATGKAYFIPSDSTAFENTSRKDKQEPPRFYNKALMISADSSFIDSSGNTFGNYLQNTNLAFNFSQNAPADDIRIAISVLNTLQSETTAPETTRVVLEFVNNTTTLGATSLKAKVVANISNTDLIDPETSQDNRYFIIKKNRSDFTEDTGFSWSNINLINLYACVVENKEANISIAAMTASTATVTVPSGHTLYPGMTFNVELVNAPYDYFNGNNFIVSSVTDTTVTFTHPTGVVTPVSASVSTGKITYNGGTSDYKIIFDGMRLENNTTENPLYSMVAYDIIIESSGYPVIKTENSNNYIEYRLAVGVESG